MPTAYINIGSNQGDRRDNISRAVALIADTIDPYLHLSDLVESEPWGYDSTASFLNLGIALTTDLHPLILLDRLLDIEHSISSASHRTTDGTYADRIIDIDLIAYDDTQTDDAITPAGNRLTLPHPRMHLRPFVLIPMQQLDPAWQHPGLHLTASQLLHSLK